MSRVLRFTKMHGAGNDYVVLDGIREALPPRITSYNVCYTKLLRLVS